MTKATYFAAGHSLFHHHISEEYFLNSLFFNLLFSPEPLAFADHFFFSKYFQNEIVAKNRKNSWILEALDAGLIETHVKPGFDDYRHRLSNQIAWKARGIPSDADVIASRVDKLRGKREIPLTKNYGVAYLERMNQILAKPTSALQAYDDSEQASSLAKFWDDPEVLILKTKVFDRAQAITIETNTEGLRLAAYIQALREHYFGTPGDTGDSVQSLVDDLRTSTEYGSEVAQRVSRFLKVCCDTFNFSMAQCIDAQPNSPKADFDFFRLQGLSDGTRPSEDAPHSIITVVDTVLPSISQINQSPAVKMRRCREEGEEYFYPALRAWRSSPSDEDAALSLRWASEKFCKFVTAEISGTRADEYAKIVMSIPQKFRGNALKKGAIAVGASILAGTLVDATWEHGQNQHLSFEAFANGTTLAVISATMAASFAFGANQIRASKERTRSLRMQSTMTMSHLGDVSIDQARI